MGIKEITEENFDEIFDNRNNVCVVDFFANWCGPCKMLSPILEEISKEYTNISFYKINIDDSATLARNYGVMSIPTLIFFKNNEVKKTMIGLQSKDELINAIKELDN